MQCLGWRWLVAVLLLLLLPLRLRAAISLMNCLDVFETVLGVCYRFSLFRPLIFTTSNISSVTAAAALPTTYTHTHTQREKEKILKQKNERNRVDARALYINSFICLFSSIVVFVVFSSSWSSSSSSPPISRSRFPVALRSSFSFQH